MRLVFVSGSMKGIEAEEEHICENLEDSLQQCSWMEQRCNETFKIYRESSAASKGEKILLSPMDKPWSRKTVPPHSPHSDSHVAAIVAVGLQVSLIHSYFLFDNNQLKWY